LYSLEFLVLHLQLDLVYMQLVNQAMRVRLRIALIVSRRITTSAQPVFCPAA